MHKEENKHHLLSHNLETTTTYMLAFHLRIAEKLVCVRHVLVSALPFLGKPVSMPLA